MYFVLHFQSFPINAILIRVYFPIHLLCPRVASIFSVLATSLCISSCTFSHFKSSRPLPVPPCPSLPLSLSASHSLSLPFTTLYYTTFFEKKKERNSQRRLASSKKRASGWLKCVSCEHTRAYVSASASACIREHGRMRQSIR
jgi:hypothetical protein